MPDLTEAQWLALQSAYQDFESVHELRSGNDPDAPAAIFRAGFRAALKLIDEQQAALNAHESAVARAKRERPALNFLFGPDWAAEGEVPPVVIQHATRAIVEAINANTKAIREQAPAMNAVVERLDLSLHNALSTLEGVLLRSGR